MGEPSTVGPAAVDHPVVVFVGPCLWGRPRTRPWHSPRLELCPPVGRGDVLRALQRHDRQRHDRQRHDRQHHDPGNPATLTLVLLDGYYYTRPAVTHKEITHALELGVRVIGAASMGALRAAELGPLGMEGVGRVHGWFRDGVLDGDDEVALLHGPAERDHEPLTVALVEVRHAVARLARRGRITADSADDLVASLKALPFVDRRFDVLQREAQDRWGESVAQDLEHSIRQRGLKAVDADLALRHALRSPPHTTRPGHRPTPRDTIYLTHFRQEAHGSPEATHSDAWSVAQVLHPAAPHFVQAVRHRFLLASAAEAAGLALDDPIDPVGGPLPHADQLAEAQLDALARAALDHFRDPEHAFEALGRHLGAPRGDGAALCRHVLHHQADALPRWQLVRAFTCTAALEAAAQTAAHARRLAEAFRNQHRGQRISRQDLEQLAMDLWQCSHDTLDREAVRRALFPTDGYAPGFDETLERLIVAERLAALGSPDAAEYIAARALMVDSPLELA